MSYSSQGVFEWRTGLPTSQELFQSEAIDLLI
jgi:hypothetical protein